MDAIQKFEDLATRHGVPYAYGAMASSFVWGQYLEEYITIHHMQEGIAKYVLFGVPVGSFLQAVIENDLFGATGHADENNKHRLFEYCAFFYNGAPSSCYRTPERYAAWVGHGGLLGAARSEV